MINSTRVLLNFLVTVKTVTLIFISGRGSALLSAQKGKSCSIYLVKKIWISCLSHANKHAFHENPDHIFTDLKFFKP